MSAPWPPPPDLSSIRELVAAADLEGFIAEGAPIDEYDCEADQLQESIVGLQSEDLTAATLLPIIELIWGKDFNLAGPELARRRPALTKLVDQINRFFGPEATPQTRSPSL